MSKPWDVLRLRELIEHVHGREHMERARPHIDAVHWKIELARFHSHGARGAFAETFEEDSSPSEAMRRMFSDGKPDLMTAKIAYEAHAIAYAHAIHSVGDVIAWVIVLALGVYLPPSVDVTLGTIRGLVPRGPLKDAIAQVRGLKEFNYLNDFINQTKHVSLVFSSYSVDLTGEDTQSHGVRFNSFTYKGTEHPTKWGDEFLLDLVKVAEGYVEVGRRLNDVMEQIDSMPPRPAPDIVGMRELLHAARLP